MPVTPTATTTPTAAATAGPPAAAKKPGELGKDDFLKLLAGQLKAQSPLSPSSDTEFLGQMTQFSMLEQIQNMAASTAQMQSALVAGQGFDLVGKDVTYTAADGTATSGTVEKVTFAGGVPTFTVGDVDGIALGQVTEVR